MRLTEYLNGNGSGELTASQYQRLQKRYPFVVMVTAEYQQERKGEDPLPELWPREPESKEEAILFIRDCRRMRRYEEKYGIESPRGLIIVEETDSEGTATEWPPHLEPYREETDILFEAHLFHKFDISAEEIE